MKSPKKVENAENTAMNTRSSKATRKSSVLLLLLPLLMLGLSTAACRADALDNWTWRNPVPIGFSPLTAVAFGNGTWVTLGDDGTVYVSTDTINWTDANTGPQSINSLAFVDGEFIVVGDGGTIETSLDGFNWQNQNSGTDRDLQGIAYGNGMFVAVGDFGTVLTSLDGVNWNQSNSGTGEDLQSIVFGNGIFVAVGNDNVVITSDQDSTSTTSPIGISWTIQNPQTYPYYLFKSLTKIVFGEGLFIAIDSTGNTVEVSPDGANWIITNTPGLYPPPANTWPNSPITGIVHGNQQFVTVGGTASSESEVMPTVITGTTGAVIFTGLPAVLSGTWTNSLQQTPSYASGLGVANAIAYGNGIYMAVGGVGLGDVWISHEGLYWTDRLTGFPNQGGETAPTPDPTSFQDLNAAAFADNTFVVVGDGGEIATSSWTPVTSLDGITWEERQQGTNGYDLTGIAYGNGTWVTVGIGAILTSTDAVTWLQSSGTTAGYQSIAFGKNTFVAAGPNGIGTSPTGVTWTPGTISASGSTTADLAGVTYGNGTFAGVGACVTTFTVTTSTTILSGTIKIVVPVTKQVTTTKEAALVSPDGIFWTEYPINSPVGSLLSVAYANGTFVATGSSGAIFTSPDGTNWLQEQAGTYNNLNSVAGSNGSFVVVGDNGTLLTSTDGIVWTPRATTRARPQDLDGVAYGYGTFLAVGAKGTILQSQPLDGIGPVAISGSGGSTAGGVVLTGTVNPNGKQTSVAFEYSTDENSLKWDGSLYYGIVSAWSNNPTTTTLPTIVPAGYNNVVVSTTISGLGSGEFYFRVEAANSQGDNQGAIVMGNPIPPNITSTDSIAGTEGAPFTFHVAATNVPTAFTATGLPAGLAIDPSAGVISGTPTENGSFTVDLSAGNGGGTGNQTLTIDLAIPSAPTITSGLYVNAAEGSPFLYQIEGTNYPDSFSAVNLPAGLAIDSTTGLVSGTATVSGTLTATITASNAGGSDTETLNFTILPTPPMITSATTASGTSGQAFQYQILASGSTTVYGAVGLPPGVGVNPSTGMISGTPTMGGSFNAMLTADNPGGEGTATLGLLIDTNLAPFAGHYQGLGIGGSLMFATVNKNGHFTGKITAGGNVYTIAGQLNNYGTFSETKQIGAASLQITLAATTLPSLTGTVNINSAGTSSSYDLSASKAGAFTATTLPPGLKGYYTAILLSSTTGVAAGAPGAPGFAGMTVSASGGIHLSGKLGDGTPFTAVSQLDADGETWPLFVTLYAGKNPGLIEGTMTFNQNAESDCAGTLSWVKPAQTTGKYYAGGFSTTTTLEAARYSAPPLASGTAILTIQGGDLNQSVITENLNISKSGNVTPADKQVSLSLNQGTGIFSGSFTNPETNNKASFWGAIYQKAPAEGIGLFLGTDQTGTVNISQ